MPLRRLSVAYASQRDVNPASVTVLVNIPAYVNALTDARVGASDPHEFLRSMKQAALTDIPPLSRTARVMLVAGQRAPTNASSSAPPPTMSLASAVPTMREPSTMTFMSSCSTPWWAE